MLQSEHIAQETVLVRKSLPPFPWATISKWLRNCDLHENCCKTMLRYLPTRLLDLIPAPRASGVLARLCDTTLISGDVQYATLSHCWGGGDMIKLTQSNLKRFNQDGIQVHELPKSFKDAVTVTMELGVRYLWIDSLCIRQDSLQEWYHESARMAQVYSNGYVNISATTASDGSGGLNISREGMNPEPERLFLDLGEGNITYRLESNSFWAEQVVNTPLNYRAWVVQERLLSRRNLHFGLNQLFWECNTISACETHPQGLPHSVLQAGIKQSISKLLRGSIEGMEPMKACRHWGSIVEMYSRGYLSVQTDKLVAISGLATLAHQVIGGRYLAGLWETLLPQELLWVSTLFRVNSYDYTAPSWSWASCNTGVTVTQRFDPTDKVLITVIDASVDLVNPENVFGQVRDGHIIMQCSLVTARPEKDLNFGKHLQMNSDGGCDFELNERFDRPWPSPETQDPDAWTLLPVLHTTQDASGEIHEHIHGLILDPVNIKLGVFQRIGVWALRNVGTIGRIRRACTYFDQGALAGRLKRRNIGDLGYEYIIKLI